MMTPTTVFLARHGQSIWNGTQRVSGQLNPPLSDDGKAQARALEVFLRGTPLTAIYCSTLQRAIDTAAPVARSHGLRLTCCDALNEQNLGILQGRYRDARDPEAMALWQQRAQERHTFRIPGAETQEELTYRVRHWLDETLCCNPDGVVLIVGHRNSNRVIMGTLLGMPPTEWGELRPRSRIVHQIDLASGRCQPHSLAQRPFPTETPCDTR